MSPVLPVAFGSGIINHLSHTELDVLPPLCRAPIVDEESDHVQYSKTNAESEEKVDAMLRVTLLGDAHELQRILPFCWRDRAETYVRAIWQLIEV